jgi:NAD(P)H-dependent flavin oxidoreductase YrpB (nitropropane dioxygenase family)
MDISRRRFTAGALLLSTGALTAAPHAAEKTAKPYRETEAQRRLMSRLGIRHPIVQAVFGGGTPELAAAVAEAGALGGMGMSWSSEAEVRAAVQRARALTRKPFAIGYVMQFGAGTLQAALDAGAPVIQFSFGIPDAAQVAAIRKAGAKFGVQIGNARGAGLAVAAGADYINVQGQEAGGHVQAQGSWRDRLPEVIAVAGDVPVLVAGGLATGADLREVLALGAAGGVFGTRFVATEEYPAHPAYKDRLAKSHAADTALTVCFDLEWPAALHRVLRNDTLEAWEAGGALARGLRPNENDVVGRLGELAFKRYSIFPPFVPTTGRPEDMAMYAGIGVERIRDTPKAGELVARIWKECVGA